MGGLVDRVGAPLVDLMAPPSCTPRSRGGDPWRIFRRGTTRQRAPIRAVISLQGAPTQATSLTRASPICTPRSIGGDPWQIFRGPPQTNTIWGGVEQSTLHRRGQGLERTHGGAHSHRGRDNSPPQPPRHTGSRSPNPHPNHHRELREGAGHRQASLRSACRTPPCRRCSSKDERGDGRRGVGPSFPFTSRPGGKGGSSLPPPPTLCVWGGGRR